MRHECGLCLRDNMSCQIRKSFWQIVFGEVDDCSIYDDYHKGLMKHNLKVIQMKKKG